MKQIFELKDWHTQAFDHVCLRGDVYNNPRFDDGEFVRTSSVLFVDYETRIVETYSGSFYHLDETEDIHKLPEITELGKFRQYWAGRKFRCNITGKEFIIPNDVKECDWFPVGESYIDVGRGNSYCRFGGDIVDITEDNTDV